MKPDAPRTVQPAHGRLGVLLPGMGAVATTFIAGVESVRRGLARPVGSVTQLGTIRLGKRTEGRAPTIRPTSHHGTTMVAVVRRGGARS